MGETNPTNPTPIAGEPSSTQQRRKKIFSAKPTYKPTLLHA